MSGASENHKVHYNPRTVPKPPNEFQKKCFPFIEKCNISLNALDVSDQSPISCAFLDFMERGITVLIQYVTQLINTSRTHILFDHEVSRMNYY